MLNYYSIVESLTSGRLLEANRVRTLNDFARQWGWHPSDQLTIPSLDDLAAAHLVVEHGLQNTAVITFLRAPHRYSELQSGDRKRLLSVSYNNLVDWHIQVEHDEVSFVYNRGDPPTTVERRELSQGHLDALRREVFEKIVGRRPSPNIVALDDALMDTIRYWKRSLPADLGRDVPNEALSALFNAIIFVRAVEDHGRRFASRSPMEGQEPPASVLIDEWRSMDAVNATLRDVLLRALAKLKKPEVPSYLVDQKLLGLFDGLSSRTAYYLLRDFYHNKYTSYYDYDFSIMSKHALSRIYEHYVSILRPVEPPQPTLPLLHTLPEEVREKAFGSVYTPQFIARFFARYLREHMPPLAFKRLRAADPACGSGIFLRTLLEQQFDPIENGVTSEAIDKAFASVLGLDVAEDASHAASLSLALLYLVLMQDVPKSLNIHCADAIEYLDSHPEVRSGFDAVLANPPFVPVATLAPAVRKSVMEFMGEHASGRIDMYLPFLLMGLEMLKPGGYGLFVLPHSFLIANNASGMRRLLSEKAWILCLADLSAIRVFEDTSSYVVLLIFQKRPETGDRPPFATIVKCQDLVGQALQQVIEGPRTENRFFSVFDVEQEEFREGDWRIQPVTEAALRRRFEAFPKLEAFMKIREGANPGASSVHILSAGKVPEGEDDLFVPLLDDREMISYGAPSEVSQRLFYPFIDGKRIDESTLVQRFPKTWAYLQTHREALERRASVLKGDFAWWEPERPRLPRNMMRPKIVSPHLVLAPRFGLDKGGEFAVARSPILYPREDQSGVELDLLRFFLAVLNSSPFYWYVANRSHTYQKGYVMLEPKTLRPTPVPDPRTVDATQMRKLLGLVDKRLAAPVAEWQNIERQIDDIVADLYQLTDEERREIGMLE